MIAKNVPMRSRARAPTCSPLLRQCIHHCTAHNCTCKLKYFTILKYVLRMELVVPIA